MHNSKIFCIFVVNNLKITKMNNVISFNNNSILNEGQTEGTPKKVSFGNNAKYKEALSFLMELMSEFSNEIYSNLFNLACQGKWEGWNEKQPVGATIHVDEDMLRSTGDRNINL